MLTMLNPGVVCYSTWYLAHWILTLFTPGSSGIGAKWVARHLTHGLLFVLDQTRPGSITQILNSLGFLGLFPGLLSMQRLATTPS